MKPGKEAQHSPLIEEFNAGTHFDGDCAIGHLNETLSPFLAEELDLMTIERVEIVEPASELVKLRPL
ncbi:hypothetical protein NDN08_005325 [Rhodosorus marinus]|uniref:Uncharacterized protein n=1 Tax=Rhodosorus marinus TaxID=101924 RepID=A0AAV8V284_9RHOD|nr:hypothetical protein NDN08_005325 [Rhodosorus marinus]